MPFCALSQVAARTVECEQPPKHTIVHNTQIANYCRQAFEDVSTLCANIEIEQN